MTAIITVRFDKPVDFRSHYISLHHIVVEIDGAFQAYLFPLRCRFSDGETPDIVRIEALDLDINASSIAKMNAIKDNLEKHAITGVTDVFIDTGDLEVDPELTPIGVLSFQLMSESGTILASDEALKKCSIIGRFPDVPVKADAGKGKGCERVFTICRKEVSFGYFDVCASSEEEALEKFLIMLSNGQIDLSNMEVLEDYNEVSK